MRSVAETLKPTPLEFFFFHPASGHHDNSHFAMIAARLGWLRLAWLAASAWQQVANSKK